MKNQNKNYSNPFMNVSMQSIENLNQNPKRKKEKEKGIACKNENPQSKITSMTRVRERESRPSEERNKLVPVNRERLLKPLSHALAIISARHRRSSSDTDGRRTKNEKEKERKREGGVVKRLRASPRG